MNQHVVKMTKQNGGKTVEIIPAECTLHMHQFSEKFMDTKVHFSVLKMDESIFLWAGTTAKMPDISVAMKLSMESAPGATKLFGEMEDQASINLSKHLAKKTNKQVFVSCSLPDDQLLISAIEKRVAKELSDHPDKF